MTIIVMNGNYYIEAENGLQQISAALANDLYESNEIEEVIYHDYE